MPTAKKTAESKPVTDAETTVETKTEEKTPKLDFSSLVATDAPASAIKHTRGPRAGNSQLDTWLKETHKSGEAKAVTVPAAQAATLSNAIRNAAKRLDIGHRKTVTKNDDGTVTVTFKGADKIERKKDDTPTADVAPAEAPGE